MKRNLKTIHVDVYNLDQEFLVYYRLTDMQHAAVKR